MLLQLSKKVALNFTSLIWHRTGDRAAGAFASAASLAPNRPLSADDMERIERRMDDRQQLLDAKCHEYGLHRSGNDSLHRPNAWEFLVSRQHHLIWCNVFKAASSSWMYNFNILAGYSPAFLRKTNVVSLSLARRKYPRVTAAELLRAQNDSTTFLIVRHPFERLLSAYRDKFMYAVPHSYHDKLGNQIIKKYRPAKPKLWIQTKWPSFGEFVAFLLDERRRNATLDMHWTPTVQFCTPCQIHFDIIAKFETLDEDQRYVIARSRLGRYIVPQWKNSGKGQKTPDLHRTYFGQLSVKQIEQLYDMFRYERVAIRFGWWTCD